MNQFQSKTHLKKSGILFATVLMLVFGLIPFFLNGELKVSIIIISIAIYFISFISPYSLRKPYTYWMKFGSIMSKFNSILLLSIFFYIVITPAAIIRRLFLLTNRTKKSNTYFSYSQPSKINFKDQF